MNYTCCYFTARRFSRFDLIVQHVSDEIHGLGVAIKDDYTVAMDIRDIDDQNERRRILDFVTGMAFVSNSTIRSINRDGVFLILPATSSLPSSERERLQNLGLYKINV